MKDLDLIKQAIARTASETGLRSEHRAVLERLLDHIADLERKRDQ
jgi:hypothetical protein